MRPGHWNQDDLLKERDKFVVNDVVHGLTGWTQIDGRDELDIADKANLDGDYVKQVSFAMDVKCFFGIIAVLLKSDGIAEDNRKNENTQV